MSDSSAENSPDQKISIIFSKGSLDMAYPGLVLANAALMSGIGVNLFFTFWGLDIVTKKKEGHLHVSTVGNPSLPIPTWLGGVPGMEGMASMMMRRQIEKLDIPPVPEFIEMISDAGGNLYACKLAMDMMSLEKDDLDEHVDEVIGAMEFYEVAAGGSIIFI